MQIQQQYSLLRYNTFGIDVKAKYFLPFYTIEELAEAIAYFKNEDKLILGGGSNILFTKDFNGVVLKNEIGGIELVHETIDEVIIKVGAGQNWHQLVMYCVNSGWGGIENLALIPGNAGAAPMQNIGAYGAEIKDVFHNLTAFSFAEGTTYKLDNAACNFGYRESIFKKELKHKVAITEVCLRLQKKPVINSSYGAINQQLELMGIQTPAIADIARAVIQIRSSKLPDPSVAGNAGSFFKNPVISPEHYKALLQLHPGIVGYPLNTGEVKLAAGWLIEATGWKGKSMGNAAVHDKQALVLVNKGNATGSDVLALCSEVIHTVEEKFGVLLQPEVNIY